LRLKVYMYSRWIQSLVAALLACLLAGPPLPGQARQNSAAADDSHAMVKPDPKRAKKLMELGAKEEAAGADEAALAAYDEAVRYAPFDVVILGKAAALRSKLVHGYVDRAERAAVEGNLLGATQALAAALQIDPSNATVLERLKQMESMRAANKEVQTHEPIQGLPRLNPDKGKKSFHFHIDLRTAYQQVAAAYGLKAAFDADLPNRNVKLQLDDVDFETAMQVLTAETRTFWKPLSSNMIFVAADTAEKRKAFETVIEQTFVLPESTTPTEMADIVKAVREVTGAQRVQLSLNAHSLTMRDTIPRVHLAEAMIKDLEKGHGEVLLEIEFLEVDRNTATQLGITPPANTTMIHVPQNLVSALYMAPSYTALLTLLSSVFGTSASGGLTSLSSAIPPIAAFGGGKSTFLVTLPTFSGEFSKSLNLVRSGRQVLLRAQEGQPATFFAGERYPITLSLLSGSLGTGGLTPSIGGVSTTTIGTEQFTVGHSPVAMTTADFRGISSQDLAVVNQGDNTLTILLNQGANATSQFAQAPGSPIALGPAPSSTTSGIVSPAVSLTITGATLKSISILPATASLAPSGTQQFTATGIFSDGSRQDITADVTWDSSNTAVATIGAQTGLAVGQGAGTTAITATLGNISSPAASLTGTSAALQSIALAPASVSVARNGTAQIQAIGTFSDGTQQNVTSSATWTSSNTGIASVGVGSGLVRGITSGSAQITAVIGTVKSSPAPVTVTSAALKSISVSPVNRAVAVGTSVQYTATGTYSDGSTQDVTSAAAWTSSKTSVAEIGASSGLATGVAAGTTSITATQGGAGSPVAIASGTVNTQNNDIPDLLIASQINNSVMVLLGNGDGTFTNPKQAVTYTVGNQPSGIVLGTFNANNDANLDFVVTNFADNSYSVFTGNGNGTFNEVKGSPFPLPSGDIGPIAITSADFNGDGKPDLAIVNQTSKNVTILEGNGNGTFTQFPKSPLAVGNFPVAIASGTLDGSTGPGLAIANQNDDSVTVYLGNGDGTFVQASQSPLAVTSSPAGVVIADLAGTSTGGIAVTSEGSGTVVVYVDLGSGLFAKALEPSAGTNPDAILAGDFTGSALPDIVVTNDISGADGYVTLLVSPTSAIGTSSVAQTPYPGSEYVDIGLKVKATPYVHPDNEVTLQMEYELKALTGANNNGIPIISNESFSQTVRLKEGETSIVSGLLDREMTKSLTGIPGLAKIPYAGYLFGSENSNTTDNELLILITPRELRIPDHELHEIYAGRGEATGAGSAGAITPGPPEAQQEERPQNAPITPAAPPGQENQPQPAAPPPTEPPRRPE
jgi:type II secretory pathway component GspD/PulD (secretin)